MLSLRLIAHSDISDELLNTIIEIKSTAWPYSKSKQINWISQNIKPDDIHAVLCENDEPVAYMNLINEIVMIDHVKTKVMGIGNVCAKTKGAGYGKALLQLVNNYLLNHNKKGILFCKEKLIPFYTKCEWFRMQKDKVLVNGEKPDFEVMGYNITDSNNIEYTGKLF